METEKFYTGYCRMLDAPRTVEIILEEGKLTEADCCYGDCLYQGSCPIAREIEAII